jgi:hypothetical protein
MRKSLAACLFAAAAALIASPVDAAYMLPQGLAPGSEYQLMFTTAGGTTATSPNISYYNTFVTNEAALNPSLPSTTWNAVASTATVNADANAPNLMVDGSYLPVYTTIGVEVSNAEGLYSGNYLLRPVEYNQYGNPAYSNGYMVWTGSTALGVASAYPLGGTSATDGSARSTYPTEPFIIPSWIDNTTPAASVDTWSLYALSGPLFVPTPEPTTITLLGSAVLFLASYRLLKRRLVLCQSQKFGLARMRNSGNLPASRRFP